MDRTKFIRYAEIKSGMKKMDEELDELRPFLIEAIDEEGVKELTVTDVGKFYFKEVPVWTYSPELKDREKRLKDEQEIERKVGIATKVIRRDFGFTNKKANEQGNEEI